VARKWRLRGPRTQASPDLTALAAAAPELRAQLPLLWPDGPGGHVDVAALEALSREYARSGRGIEDLLADLDNLCDVIGIGAPSSFIEASSSAWADAFLGTVGLDRVQDEGLAMAEVERRIVRRGDAMAWGGLAPREHVLIVEWGDHAGVADAGVSTRELVQVTGLVRSFFRGSAVAAQPSLGRVIAAISDSPELGKRVAALEAACSEFSAAGRPAVSLHAAPSDASAASALLRRAG
jgi:hypothetical protein